MKTMLLAIGNAGGNIVETIRKESKNVALKKTQYVFADCDESDLKKREAENCKLIHLNTDKDGFSGGIFDGIEKLLIVAGLGGKTGTKYAELAAKSAIDAGIASINVIATLPFVFEGDNRINLATTAARRITDVNGVKVTIFNNEELLAKYPDLNLFNAFDAMDKEIMQIVEDIM